MSSLESRLAATLWSALGGDHTLLESVRFSGIGGGLPSRFHVSELATATIAVATLAAAELWAARRGEKLRAVTVDRRLAAAAFQCERLLRPLNWTLPALREPLTGDYETADGWIRLHTNYSYHRDALLRVLDVPAERGRVAAAVRSANATELETAIIDAGGCAATLRTIDAWRAHPQGAALASETLCNWDAAFAPHALLSDVSAPLRGVCVLDLTRVIAGPVATRYLAAFGADVLRIDPPEWNEPAIEPEVTVGKRCARLDLRQASDRARFERLIADADVFIHGYRPEALDGLGLGEDVRRAVNPGLVDVRLDAYGWSGPWRNRRGFDSLVQMSTGIAAAGLEWRSADKPVPLPASYRG